MRSWPAPSLPTPEAAPAGRLILRDSASGQLGPVGDGSLARLYVCGITPYDATHLGHAFTYLTFDLVNRAWRQLGHEVVYTQNITDVDDPLLERAQASGVDWRELAQDQIELFRQDMTALRVVPPQHYLGVVESLDLVTDLIARLDRLGAVYQVDDPEFPDWYFACRQAPGFGQLSHWDDQRMEAVFAERGGDPGRPGKRDRLDCLIWRLARAGEPSWDSPLGAGRPGWHVECTAIALNRLGSAFDLQGGGSDLVFPHHEMCAAEAQWATGQPFARSYLHVGMVGLDGQKMSKSRGNLVLVSQLRQAGADPMAIRLALLNHHYAAAWSWSQSDLAEAEDRLRRWRGAIRAVRSAPADETVRAVRQAILDDLKADRALAAVDAWVEAGRSASADVSGARAAVARVVDAWLGVAL
ncbi:MAG: cysteine--1-D-myo-inosityl 2-amino-2-deoxy-alpha-D-glucopyranoside ligase [Propionibacteriaceae bacterium]|jgi:L-cysteine:1D-myo-inositol 2-amino-2-deoxy-alpha-D-glucopyranoside ligase|nr:cysteine--1-D-myo-inosityl 2-amino-2-deoxy-alpha-D-glucopyranoside ligase [Propionibacteriaceae bacterium]